MTNSENSKTATAIINKVLELTDEAYLQRQIDTPIEKVLSDFEIDSNAKITHRNFMDILTDFVGRIHVSGPGSTQYLSRSQASAEAFFIVEKALGTPDVPGYDAALVEAFDDVESVLQKIAGFILFMIRDRHIKWVYATCIGCLDWPTKCLITKILVKKYKAYLPQTILSCSPAQFVDALPQLFSAVQSTESAVKNTLGSHPEFHASSETLGPILPLFK